MKFLVVGPGAMGCLFAARLKKAGFEIALFDYLGERAAKINEQGLIVEGVSGEYTTNVPTGTGDLPFAPDFALICVKSYKTAEACRSIQAQFKTQFPQELNSGPIVITLQNGIGNLEILEEIFGKDRALGGVTAEGATLLGPGRIRHAGRGETVIGPAGAAGDPIEKMVAAFNQAGFKTRSDDNVENLIWGKLIINVGINALTAITGLKNGRLPEIEGTSIILEKAVNEAVAVTMAKKIKLPYTDPVARVKEVCEATSGNISSMLQDVLKKKITEIDFINGAIVREGEALGISTPVNQTLTGLVLAIQETYNEKILA